MATAEELNKARGGVYGPFEGNAVVAQAIKDAMRSHPKWADIPADGKEALDIIALKVSRIVTGNDPNYLDSWDDISGYVRCVTERIRTTK